MIAGTRIRPLAVDRTSTNTVDLGDRPGSRASRVPHPDLVPLTFVVLAPSVSFARPQERRKFKDSSRFRTRAGWKSHRTEPPPSEKVQNLKEPPLEVALATITWAGHM